ncbi:L-rhamnose/proton symporter RhaT [Acidicapsa acidisoli]|uniref:L-rhamnose/proton symporter RhaT n=1 Tax=Acidicapsa acidisoli TaxID=1615681 RepID=UPI0021E057FB|nr:L-rhamnose/proton symporter RhaT [Acidicapsa acidisoli]
MTSPSSGIATLIIAGVMNASFTMPMKYARKWAWENTWLAWTIFALVVLPFVAALVTIPNLSMVYRSAPLGVILEVASFGAGWGVAQVFFGIAVDMIGITLAFSIVLGTSAAVGSLIPMVSLHREHLNSAAGYAVIGAVAFVLLGVMLCAAAGRLRDRPIRLSIASPKNTSQGLLLAIICGLAASLMNFGVAFGTPLVEVARSFGANGLNAINAIWLPLLLAGAVPNVLYCAWLMKRNRSGQKYRVGRSYWALAAMMAILWFGSTLLYGLAAGQLGAWGPILGWPLFMSLIVITATILGMFTGEWKDCGPLPIRVQWAGVTVLVLAIFILAGSSRYLQ